MMKVVVCSITIGFSFVCAEMITYHLSRNPQYDEKQTHPTNILTISKFRSLLHCATFCRSKDNCRSLLYNADNLFCELLSVHLASENILGEQGSRGWKYYELNNGKYLQCCNKMLASQKSLITLMIDNGGSRKGYAGCNPHPHLKIFWIRL